MRDEWNIFSHYFVQFGNGMAFRFGICLLVLYIGSFECSFTAYSKSKWLKIKWQIKRTNFNRCFLYAIGWTGISKWNTYIPTDKETIAEKWIIECFVTFRLCRALVATYEKRRDCQKSHQPMICTHPQQRIYAEIEFNQHKKQHKKHDEKNVK